MLHRLSPGTQRAGFCLPPYAPPWAKETPTFLVRNGSEVQRAFGPSAILLLVQFRRTRNSCQGLETADRWPTQATKDGEVDKRPIDQ
jgi:hypothetical protein